jgi:hypothetical protein
MQVVLNLLLILVERKFLWVQEIFLQYQLEEEKSGRRLGTMNMFHKLATVCRYNEYVS